MKIGKELKWEKIKIGQAFYFTGCSGLAVKVNDNFIFVIDMNDDTGRSWPIFIGQYELFYLAFNFFAIPLSLRRCLESI